MDMQKEKHIWYFNSLLCQYKIEGYHNEKYRRIQIRAVVAQLVEHIHGLSYISPLFGKSYSEFRITVKSPIQGSDRGVRLAPERLTRKAKSRLGYA